MKISGKGISKGFQRILLLLVSLLTVLLLAMVYGRFTGERDFSNRDTLLFQERFLDLEGELDKVMEQTQEEFFMKEPDSMVFQEFKQKYPDLYFRKGLSLFFYQVNQLKFWSTNLVPVPADERLMAMGPVISLGNSIYYRKTLTTDQGHLHGLILVKDEYPYENQYLENGFNKRLGLEPGVSITLNPSPESNRIYNKAGDYLFTLNFSSGKKSSGVQKVLVTLLYAIALLLLLILLNRINAIVSSINKNLVFYLTLIFLLGIYFLMTYFRFPHFFFDLDLFSYNRFSRSSLLPSLGDLLLITGFLIFFIHLFYTNFRFRLRFVEKYRVYRIWIIFVMILFSSLMFLLSVSIFRSIIIDSDISFETYKVLDLSVYTFIGFFILALLFSAYALLTDKLLVVFELMKQKQPAGIYVSMQVMVLFFIYLISDLSAVTLESVIFYSVIPFLQYYYRFVRKLEYRFSSFVVFVLLFSVFSVSEVARFSLEKNHSEMKMMAVELSEEHDPVAELLLTEINNKLRADEEIIGILNDPYFDFDFLYSTIERKYFRGFWDKYDLQITLCGPEDSVFVSPPGEEWYHCYDFFYETILDNGMPVPNTDFYYLDNLNGRISYFAPLVYELSGEEELTLFIELDTRLIAEGLGYPALLLEDSYFDATGDVSYAKYSRSRLITSNGEFAYPTLSDVYASENDGFERFRMDDHDHIIYHIDSENLIIVSKPSVFWVDILISFSYNFSFYFLVLIFLLTVSRISPMSIRPRWNFKNKIQMAMTSVLFVSFVLVGAGTVYFSIQQYKNRQYELLEEKVQSVYIELIHKLEFEDDLKTWRSDSYFNLNELLQKFSNVFQTDINLFDEQGRMLATSRPEIFEIGLIARLMNAEAYTEMKVNKRSEFAHSERVGNLRYLSVYVPFVNTENKLLAYLNLPYFTRQDELTREVTNLVVAIVNIVVLLSLLSFTIAVFISNTITLPLRLLQQKIAMISFSEQNEKIDYAGDDEVGSLVKEYNEMVDQLQQSAELLAKSERESAWREMAKQIAHEIKNPLTPMKLSIQHLQRTALEKGDQEWSERVDKISHTLIEQIDNLSSIATEFSSFAKMPLAKNEEVDLSGKLMNTIDLFKENESSEIEYINKVNEPLFVYADKKQLSRVFINLIKNGIQAVPDDREIRILITLEKIDNFARVSIKDNGRGIPAEIREKLFQPNFTTKSSGMGLGLAIVRNIINNAGGVINYHTDPGKGSEFYVDLPLINSSKNDE